MSTRQSIIDEIMLRVVLLSPKAALDQILDGLSALGFHELMVAFPQAFESVLCASAANLLQIDSPLLVSMVDAECTSGEDTMTYRHLKTYLSSLDPKGTHRLGFC